MKKIDRVTIIELDGKVIARLYTGDVYRDAELSIDALAVTVADGARVLCAAWQKQQFSKASQS